MSKLLGVIKAIIGQVYVVDANGAQRLVHEGDRVYSGEEIVTGASGAVSISLPDGKTLDIGRNSHWGEHGLQVSHHPESSAQDIAAAQKAIADGADPTQVLEATAAGNEAPVTLEGGGGGHTLVQLELTGQVVDPTAGFNTKGLGSPNWDINLPIGGVTAGSASVFPPEVQITEFAGNDGFINKSEFHQTHLSGTSNQNHITLTFTDSQKNTFTVTVPVSNGHWNIDTDLGGLVPGNVTVVAIATDVTGRTAESFDHALIDITGPHIDITVDNVTPDNLINYEESRQPQTLIHGSVGGDTKPGDIVTLLVDGKEYTGVVTDPGNGTLTYTIPVLTQGLLHDPNIHATLTSTDDAGNTTIVSTDHHVDNDLYAQNAVTIETVANDDVVNANEFRMPTIISGIASGDAKAGDPVTLTIQGKAFHGTVFDDHGQLRYEIVVPSATLKEGANDVQVTLVSHDAVGNEATAVTHRTVVLDTQAHNALTIDDVTTDNTLNRAELYMRNQVISGTVSGEDAKAGDPVLVEINGHQYNGQIIDLGNSTLGYRIAVNAADFANNVAKIDGYMDVKVTVTSHDAAGNLAIATSDHNVHIDNFAENTVHIDTVANDNVVNAIENRMTTLISGVAGGDAKAGDAVTVSVRGQNFTGAVVDDNGELRYEVAVPVGTLKEGKNDVVVTLVSHDAAGNEVTALAHRTVVLDTKAHNTVNIHDVTDDNTLNFTELSAAKQTITGNVRGEDAKAGDPVQVEINGHRYHGQVIDTGKNTLGYRIEVDSAAFSDNVGHVLKEATVHVSITSHDAAGNLAIATDTHNVHIDNFAENTVHIDTVANDNVVNAIENRMTTLISGVAGGDAKAGDAVTVSVQGQSFTGTVVDDNGELRYEVAVPVGTLKEGKNAVVVTLVSHDAVGNEVTALAHRTVVLDTKAHNTVNIHDVTADNTLNFTELSAAKQVITGNVRGEDAKAGDPVLVEINGYQYHGQVIDTGKNTLGYRIEVDSAAFSDNVGQVLKDVTVHVSVTSHDAAGNLAIATSNHNVHLDNFAENAVHIDTVAGDDLINIKEFLANGGITQITGTVTGVDAKVGDVVTLELKGGAVIHSSVIALAGGGLGYSIPVNSHKLVTHPEFTVSVTSTDPAGNSITHSETKTISADLYTQSYITIDDVTADNFINIKESTDNHGKTTISGTVSGDAKEHDTVQLVINGQHYSGEVEKLANGNLVYHIPVDTQNLVNNPVIHASIHTTDEHGNEMTAVTKHHVGLDLDASASIGIDTIASDDIISKAESNLHKTIITGPVGGDAQKDDVVTLTFNGKTYSGKVFELPDHSLGYSIEVSTDNLKDGSDQKVHVSISTVDEHGNPSTVTHDHMVHIDLHAEASITIDKVTADNTLNHSELNMAQQLITGTVDGDAKLHDVVSLEINGHTFKGEVITLNNGQLGYQIPVDSSAFSNNQGHQDKNVNIKATVVSHDAVGNEVTAISNHSVHIDNFAVNQVHIGTIAGDDVINIKEFSANGGITQIAGTVTGVDAAAGDVVELQLDGVPVMQGVVVTLAGGKLGYSFPMNTHMLMSHPEITISVTSSDAAGNSVTHSATKTISADMYTQSHITIDGVTDDNFINIKESTDHNGRTTISGTVSGDAKEYDTVELVINGQHYSGTVEKLANGGLGYHIPVDTQNLVNDPVIHASIHTTDSHGNETTATADRTVGLDLDASASIGIDTVASDDIISKAESDLHKTIITGPVGGDAQKDDVVTLTFNGKTYSGKVIELSNHSLGYSIEVSTDNLKDGSDQKVHVSISTVDEHGNPSTVTHDHMVHIDLHAEATITIDPVTDDNVLNHFELDKTWQLVSGVVGKDAQVDDDVRVEINGNTYTGKVIVLGNGQLGYQIPVLSSDFSDNQSNQDKDVTFKATVTSHDAVGNEVVKSTTHTVKIDNHAQAGITIDTVAGDNMINGAESTKHTTEVMGTVSGDVHMGDKVIVTVNGHHYDATVQKLPEHNNALGYKLDVLTGDLVKDPHIVAQVVGVDNVGNQQKAEATQDMAVDLHAKALLTIDPVTGDNMVNGDESRQPFTYVTGRVGGDVHANDTVYLTVNGHTLTGKVSDQGGHLGYSIKVSTADLLSDPHLTATVSTTDVAGNPATANAETTVVIDTRIDATITIDDVTPDNTLNYDEQHQTTTVVSGTVTGEVQKGDPLVMTINGVTYKGSVDDINGHLGYRIIVNTADLVANPHIEVTMDVTDAAKNHAHVVAHHDVNLDDRAFAAITIDRVTGDNVLNGTELQAPKTIISGTVGGDAHKGNIVHLVIDGNTVDATVVELPKLGTLGYSVEVDTQWLKNDPNITATITTHDAAGNTATADATSTVTIDDHAEAIVNIDPLVTDHHDDVISYKDAHNPQTTVTGTVGGDVRVGDLVELTINHQTYYAPVQDGSNGQHVFSTQVSTLDLLMDPNIHAEVTAKDAAGNVAHGHDDMPVVIDTLADAGITIDSASSGRPPGNPIANNLLPGSRPDFIAITGHVVPDAVIGDTVTITVGHGFVLTTQVITLPDGQLGYQADIGSDKFADNGDILVSITTHDNHGNTATATEHKFIDLPWLHYTPVIGNTPYGFTTPPVVTPPTTGTGVTQPQKPHVHLTVDPVTGDDILNGAEAQKTTTPIRGLVIGDAHVGDVVTVIINHQSHTGKVFEIPGLPGELAWQVDVPSSELKTHPTFEVSITVNNAAGSDTSSVPKTIQVDTDNPVHITMNQVAGDDVINGKEAQSGKTTISGTVSGEGIHDGSVVTLQVNGNTLTTVVHADHGQWAWSQEVSINDLRNTPDITASVSATDAAGNTGTDSTSKHVEVDLKADAGVTVNNITADNVLNAQETGQPTIAVSGSVSGDVNPGESVTLKVNGQTYTATIDANKHYTVDVQTSDLVADHSIKATVTGHDNHGNVQDANFTKAFSVDTTATAAVTVNTVGGDDVINAAEIQAGKVEVSGTVDGDVHKTDKVYITVNGNQVEATVIELPHMNGQLGYKAFVSTSDLQADPTIHVSVTGHDTAGNIQTATYDKIVIIDERVDATIVLDTVSNDDVLNNVEAGKPTTTITGSVTGDVEVGDLVTVTVNGKDLTAKVTDNGGHKVFHVEASTVDLVHNQHITAHVVAHDDAGNRQQIDTDKTILIDRVASGTVDIDSVTADNVLNHQELSGQKVTITGHVGGDAQLYDPVTLTIGGHKYQGSVITLSGGGLGYQIDVDSAVLRSDAHKVIDVELTGHDAPGNPFTAKSTHTYSVDEQANGAITINDHIAGDNVVNLNESKSDTVIKFTVSGDTHPTDVVDVSINGNNMKATLVPGSSTVYQVAVPGTYLNEGDNKIEVKTTLHDDAGNTLDVHDQKNVVLDTHADGAITINDGIAADNVVNLKESQSDTVIRFTVSGDTHSTDVVEVNINGHLMKATLAPGSSTVYQVAVQSAYLKEGINDIDVKTTLHDGAGNTIDVSDHKTIVLDTHADASIVVDKIAGDNHISRAESHDTVTHITGSVSGDVNDGDHIKALVNGHQYDAILHQGINGLTYDIEADTSAFRAGHNRVNVLVEAHDNHGNITPYSQTLNVTMDEPAPVKGHSVDQGNHAAMQQALHNLFDDNALSLSYAPAATGHGQATAVLSADDKAKGVLEKVDLSDLARELHEGVDIAKYIQSGGDHHLIASPAKVAHGIDTALSTPASGDLHSPTYSLDHLIAKPDQNHTH
ncbi:retention module-containing protein [Citrobacter portucalensis]|uniref:retention module-containing protein n=8 Tax=Citrobacter portucalensis TaxID=1639133 RepID=UPI00226B1DE8|nr:retention module-containing protein [Citrobacter portucalensis]MCX9022322.1 retention module-containing protein [Citrobacter portucalensis]